MNNPFLLKIAASVLFIGVVGTAAIGAMINGTPNNMVFAAFMVIGIIEFVRTVWKRNS